MFKNFEVTIPDRNLDVSIELSSTPIEKSIMVIDNGLLLYPERDYTLEDRTISFKKVESFGSKVIVSYIENEAV